MINIVIPMAGRGSRFVNEGYILPKPLIDVHGKPMIERVVNNLTPQCSHRFIFICQEEHVKEYGLKSLLSHIAPGCEIVTTDGITDGAACSVMLTEHLIDNSDHLMIANSDQWVDVNINDYLRVMNEQNLDGLIMTMKADDPKWSFVGFDTHGKVNNVVEKQVISDEATVGIYNFRNGSEFCASVKKMIANDLRVNGEFYVAPAYNLLIDDNAKIGIYNVGEEMNGMYGLGIPSDLKLFLAHPISNQLFLEK